MRANLRTSILDLWTFLKDWSGALRLMETILKK